MVTTELIRELKNGNVTAFEQVFEQLYDHVWSICFKYTRCRESSEEITHDSFMLLWQNRHLIDLERGINAYLSTIARNEVFRWIKKQATENTKRQALQAQFATFKDIDSENALHANMDLSRLRKFINNFPEKRRRVFELVKLGELTYNEAAEQLSISRDAVKDHMMKANRSLMQLKKNGEFLYHIVVLLMLLY